MIGHGSVHGTIRVGGDGRFGLSLVECAACSQRLEGLTGVRLELGAEEYPLAVLEPERVWADHVRASPTCAKYTLPPRTIGRPREAARWELGVLVHLPRPEHRP